MEYKDGVQEWSRRVEYRAGLEGRSTGMKYKDEVQEWSRRVEYMAGLEG